SSAATSWPSKRRARRRKRCRPARAAATAGECSAPARSELQRLAALERARETPRQAEDDDEPQHRDRRRISEVERLPLEGALDHIGDDGFRAPHVTAARHYPHQREMLH